jgi:hypothetical protein
MLPHSRTWVTQHSCAPEVRDSCTYCSCPLSSLLWLERRHALQPPQAEVWVAPHAAAFTAVVRGLPEACQRLLRVAAAATATGAIRWPNDLHAALLKDPASTPAAAQVQPRVNERRQNCLLAR